MLKKQWGVGSSNSVIFPVSVTTTYAVICGKKDTDANSIPGAYSYSSTGFTYKGATPYAWCAFCKA